MEPAGITSRSDASAPLAAAERRTYCRFCLGLCGLVVELDGERVVGVRGDREHPISRGYTCPKGRALGAWHHHPRRLDAPLVGRGEARVRRGWTETLDDLGGRLRAIADAHGPAAIAGYEGTAAAFDAASAAFAGRFLDALGSPGRYTAMTVDVPSAVLVAELVTGNPWLVPVPDPDARLVLFLGSNPMHSHGHCMNMSRPKAWLRRWAHDGELWVVDPRRSETAAVATRHLAVRPGSDHALLAHVVRELLREGADRDWLERTADGVERLAAAVEPFDRERAAAATGLDPAELDDLVAAVRRAPGGVAVHTAGTGVSFARGANVTTWLAWALGAVTGSLDRAGGMAFRPGLLRRYDRDGWEVSDGVPEPGPPSRPELPRRWGQYPAAALVDEMASGSVRALVVTGGNPLTALPDTARVVEALRRLELLVVIDVVEHELTDLATHVLPSTGQLERADLDDKDFFGMEPVLQLTPPVVAAGGERRAPWWILAQLARRLGHDLMPAGLDVETASDLDVLRALHGGDDELWSRLEAASPGPLLGDVPPAGWVAAHLPAGRWRIAPAPLVEQLAALQDPPADGLLLVPRRMLRKVNSVLADGHGMREPARAEAELHPRDAAAAGLADGAQARVRSRHGSVELPVRVTARVAPGTLSLANGFAEAFAGHLVSATELDPLTGMPEQGALEVTVEPLRS